MSPLPFPSSCSSCLRGRQPPSSESQPSLPTRILLVSCCVSESLPFDVLPLSTTRGVLAAFELHHLQREALPSICLLHGSSTEMAIDD
ncbi:hypothetical protein C8F01DRAFT_1260872 [Mycena amicta]|nr:hypothetical protein C8F01DRAFT_1260872 [Mycena amicta]